MKNLYLFYTILCSVLLVGCASLVATPSPSQIASQEVSQARTISNKYGLDDAQIIFDVDNTLEVHSIKFNSLSDVQKLNYLNELGGIINDPNHIPAVLSGTVAYRCENIPCDGSYLTNGSTVFPNGHPTPDLTAIAENVNMINQVGTYSSSGSGNTSSSATYSVTGLGQAMLTYQNASGGTEQQTVSLPWSYTIPDVTSGQFLYISAQLQSSGNVSCEITVNGATIQSANSSGDYVIASCSGTAP